jgi:chorismate mutase
MAEAVTELLLELMSRNSISTDDLISVLFTSTPDLHSAFPAAAPALYPIDSSLHLVVTAM